MLCRDLLLNITKFIKVDNAILFFNNNEQYCFILKYFSFNSNDYITFIDKRNYDIWFFPNINVDFLTLTSVLWNEYNIKKYILYMLKCFIDKKLFFKGGNLITIKFYNKTFFSIVISYDYNFDIKKHFDPVLNLNSRYIFFNCHNITCIGIHNNKNIYKIKKMF